MGGKWRRREKGKGWFEEVCVCVGGGGGGRVREDSGGGDRYRFRQKSRKLGLDSHGKMTSYSESQTQSTFSVPSKKFVGCTEIFK